MNKQTIPFILIVCFALLHPLPAQSVDHLTNAIESLKIVAGMESDDFNDINEYILHYFKKESPGAGSLLLFVHTYLGPQAARGCVKNKAEGLHST